MAGTRSGRRSWPVSKSQFRRDPEGCLDVPESQHLAPPRSIAGAGIGALAHERLSSQQIKLPTRASIRIGRLEDKANTEQWSSNLEAVEALTCADASGALRGSSEARPLAIKAML